VSEAVSLFKAAIVIGVGAIASSEEIEEEEEGTSDELGTSEDEGASDELITSEEASEELGASDELGVSEDEDASETDCETEGACSELEGLTEEVSPHPTKASKKAGRIKKLFFIFSPLFSNNKKQELFLKDFQYSSKFCYPWVNDNRYKPKMKPKENKRSRKG